MASYRRDVAPIRKTFDTVNGGMATEESLGMVPKEVRQSRTAATEPGGGAESIDTVFPDVVAASAPAGDIEEDAPEEEVAETAPEAPEEAESEDTSEDTDLPEGTMDTIASAKAYVNEAEGDERDARAQAVLTAEQDGDARVTLIDWLNDALDEG